MNSSVPFVSVVVPHLNQHDELAASLASLAAQSYPRSAFEVIVVDNGSTPVPEDVVARFEGVRLEQEPEPGPGLARNRGAAVARGEILAFIDADCRAAADWLKVIARTLNDPEGSLVVGGDVRIAFKYPDHPTMLEAYEAVFAYRQKEYIEKQGFSGTGNLAVRRKDFERIGAFAGIAVAEDKEWGRRASALGYRLAYVPEMLVFHPARRSFDELFTKWERHIAHDFGARQRSGAERAAWCVRAGAVAVSPLVDVVRIVVSDRVQGTHARALAFAALVRVRLFRAGRMLCLLLGHEGAPGPVFWNRP